MIDLKEHVLDCYPQEAVGYILDNKYFPLINTHDDPTDHFEVSPADSLMLADLDYILIHSHVQDSFDDDPRIPSHTDMMSQEASGVKWGIVHCDGNDVSDILYFGVPTDLDYLNRKYIRNVTDCFTLSRDYYKREFNLDFSNMPRPELWEHWNPHYLMDELKELPFRLVELGETNKNGDLLLYRIASRLPNHLGIYTHDGLFIHHLYNRRSCEDRLDKWTKQLSMTLRYLS